MCQVTKVYFVDWDVCEGGDRYGPRLRRHLNTGIRFVESVSHTDLRGPVRWFKRVRRVTTHVGGFVVNHGTFWDSDHPGCDHVRLNCSKVGVKW